MRFSRVGVAVIRKQDEEEELVSQLSRYEVGNYLHNLMLVSVIDGPE